MSAPCAYGSCTSSLAVAVPVLSPSLGRPAGHDGPSFELKFLISEEVADRFADRARGLWLLDPHGDPALGGAYHTTTLYCDTQALDVFHQTPGYASRKFRLRRYGIESRIFLERKTRWGDRVHKRRSTIADFELPGLDDDGMSESWPGLWFRRRLVIHRLAPVCQINYERLAFIHPGLRVTLDRRLRCGPVRTWSLDAAENGLSILTGAVVLEFKFAGHLPSSCKAMIGEFNLLPRRVSKYRAGLEVWGHRPAERRPAEVR